MKKALILVLVALIGITTVFAAENTVKASVVPYGVQITTSSAAGQTPVYSRYGLGLEATYQRRLVKGLFAEGGLGWNIFFMNDGKPVFSNILAFAGVGYSFDINNQFSCSVSADVAADTLIFNKKASENIALKAGVDVSYSINDSIRVHLGCEGTFDFGKKDATNYVNYRILPVIGASYNF